MTTPCPPRAEWTMRGAIASNRTAPPIPFESQWVRAEYADWWKAKAEAAEADRVRAAEFAAEMAAKCGALERELAREQEQHAQLQSRCYDQGGGNVFDECAARKSERDQWRSRALEALKP